MFIFFSWRWGCFVRCYSFCCYCSRNGEKKEEKKHTQIGLHKSSKCHLLTGKNSCLIQPLDLQIFFFFLFFFEVVIHSELDLPAPPLSLSNVHSKPCANFTFKCLVVPSITLTGTHFRSRTTEASGNASDRGAAPHARVKEPGFCGRDRRARAHAE